MFLVSGTVWSEQQEAIVWDISGGTAVKTGDPVKVSGVVSSISFCPNNEYFALGTPEAAVRIRRVYDQTDVVTLPGENPWITGAAFASTGNYFVSAGASGEIRLYRNWKLAGSDYDVTRFRTSDEFRRVEFFPEGDTFVTASMDGYIRVWRTGVSADYQ